jgi:hypothetical protein
MGQLLRHSVVASLFLALAAFGYGQTQDSGPAAPSSSTTAAPVPPAPSVSTASSGPSEARVGIGVKGSLLGGGVEVAARVTHRTNVRAGFDMFSYSRGFNKDSIAYAGQLNFKTVDAHFDIFPFGGKFHVSPGVLAYVGDPITATAAIPANQSFTLGGTTYYSDPSAPTSGNGKIKFNQVSPMATFGWGNLVPRNHGHFSVPVELGVAFQGAPKATLNLAGNVCTAPGGVGCTPVAGNATVQSNIIAEQTKINNSMSFFKVYPIISVGFGYSF